jgi:hypothetical protein
MRDSGFDLVQNEIEKESGAGVPSADKLREKGGSDLMTYQVGSWATLAAMRLARRL